MVRQDASSAGVPCDTCLFRFDKILKIYETMLSSVAQQLVETIESGNEQENNKIYMHAQVAQVDLYLVLQTYR